MFQQTPGLNAPDIRRVIKIRDRRTGDDLFRYTGKTTTPGIQWIACSNSIKTPFKPHESKPSNPLSPRERAGVRESPAVTHPYYISFNNTFVAQVNINNLTADQIIAQGRALFNIKNDTPIFVSFTKPCTGRSY